jgi:hypothetical protein
MRNVNSRTLPADARNVVGVGADKDKTQTYCRVVNLGRQLNQAVGEKDRMKAKALSQEIVKLWKQLPEFVGAG